MNWKIEFFNETVEDETLSFPDKILAKMLHIFEMIQENEPNLLLLCKRNKNHHTAFFCQKNSKDATKRDRYRAQAKKGD